MEETPSSIALKLLIDSSAPQQPLLTPKSGSSTSSTDSLSLRPALVMPQLSLADYQGPGNSNILGSSLSIFPASYNAFSEPLVRETSCGMRILALVSFENLRINHHNTSHFPFGHLQNQQPPCGWHCPALLSAQCMFSPILPQGSLHASVAESEKILS